MVANDFTFAWFYFHVAQEGVFASISVGEKGVCEEVLLM